MDDRDLRWQAVERAYREHADDVYRVAFAILRDPDAAVDATHDTFARAFERWHQYDANRPLRAWLHGIVSHSALDALRRRRVRTLALPAIGRVREASMADADAMVVSLARLTGLEDHVGVLPGHGAVTTIGRERSWMELVRDGGRLFA